MKHKSEVFDKFKTLLTPNCQQQYRLYAVIKVHNTIVKSISHSIRTKGIQIEDTIAYTPQQNGIAER